MIRVGIVGSRDWPDPARVHAFVQALALKYPDAIVISGGAKGVDWSAENAARGCGLGTIVYRPVCFEALEEYGGGNQWYTETLTTGEAAQGFVVDKSRRINPPTYKTFAACAKARNSWIVADSEQVVAFWDGSSRGTADTIRKAKEAGRPCWVYGVTE